MCVCARECEHARAGVGVRLRYGMRTVHGRAARICECACSCGGRKWSSVSTPSTHAHGAWESGAHMRMCLRARASVRSREPRGLLATVGGKEATCPRLVAQCSCVRRQGSQLHNATEVVPPWKCVGSAGLAGPHVRTTSDTTMRPHSVIRYFHARTHARTHNKSLHPNTGHPDLTAHVYGAYAS